jgi:hypothetical protein
VAVQNAKSAIGNAQNVIQLLMIANLILAEEIDCMHLSVFAHLELMRME